MREVRAEDPELSPTTDERLTEELRDVVGTDRVRVAADRPRATRGQHPHQHGMAARFDVNGLQLLRTTAIVLTFGAVVALITRDWWVLPLAAGVHALGTMAVTLTIIRLTTTSEHPSPTVAAAMAEEGVSHGQPSRPTGAGGAPDAMVWVTMISLLVVIIVVPPLTSGGWM